MKKGLLDDANEDLEESTVEKRSEDLIDEISGSLNDPGYSYDFAPGYQQYTTAEDKYQEYDVG